jgi:hypothetical protein
MYSLWSALGCETDRDRGRICRLGCRAGHKGSHARRRTSRARSAAARNGSSRHQRSCERAVTHPAGNNTMTELGGVAESRARSRASSTFSQESLIETLAELQGARDRVASRTFSERLF